MKEKSFSSHHVHQVNKDGDLRKVLQHENPNQNLGFLQNLQNNVYTSSDSFWILIIIVWTSLSSCERPMSKENSQPRRPQPRWRRPRTLRLPGWCCCEQTWPSPTLWWGCTDTAETQKQHIANEAVEQVPDREILASAFLSLSNTHPGFNAQWPFCIN